jgi:hypothetical protein
MTDATKAIATSIELQNPFDFVLEYAVKSTKQIWQGSGVAIGSDGNLVHASESGAVATVGRAEQSVLGDGTLKCRVRTGIFLFANDAGHLLTIANRLGLCYWTDDQTVGTDSSKLLAGLVIDVATEGAYVLMGAILPSTATLTGALLAANNLSDVAAAATAAHNLGLGTADVPTFAGSMDTNVATKTTTYGVTQAVDSGGMLITLTDGEIFNLPAVAAGNKGMEVTFINSAADGAALIKIEPNGTNTIQGQIGSVEFGGVAAKGIWNTKATQKKGDRATLRSDGTATWWVVGGQGVWASEA